MPKYVIESFNKFIRAVNNGALKSTDIDLHGINLSKKNVEGLTSALTRSDNFKTVSRITRIDLSNTNIAELPDDILKNCDNLQEINFSKNNLNSLPALPDRPWALKRLKANDNPISYINPNYFRGCISLEEIDLHHTNLPDSMALELGDCLSLIKYNRNQLGSTSSKPHKP